MSSTLTALAREVADNSKILNDFYEQSGYQGPSFEIDAIHAVLPNDAPANVVLAQQTLIGASTQMTRLCRGPRTFMTDFNHQTQMINAFRWLWHFQIHTYIPLTGSIPMTTVASLAKVPLDQLRTISRVAIIYGYLTEPTSGHLSQSATSLLYTSNPDFNGWASFYTNVMHPSSGKIIEATEKWGETTKNTESAYCLAFGTGRPMFEHLFSDPVKAGQFAGFTRAMSKTGDRDPKFLVAGFNWTGLESVVDIGGGQGYASISLLSALPHLSSALVQDLPSILTPSNISATISSITSSISSRLTFKPHDFFTPQTEIQDPIILAKVKRADVFLLRNILHDWPDDKARIILKNIIEVMKPNARILIQDVVVPAPNDVPIFSTRSKPSLSTNPNPTPTTSPPQTSFPPSELPHQIFARLGDQLMMTLLHGKERSLEDLKLLCQSVDERLVVSGWSGRLVGGVWDLIELRLVG